MDVEPNESVVWRGLGALAYSTYFKATRRKRAKPIFIDIPLWSRDKTAGCPPTKMARRIGVTASLLLLLRSAGLINFVRGSLYSYGDEVIALGSMLF